jgi:hypothetical protein
MTSFKIAINDAERLGGVGVKIGRPRLPCPLDPAFGIKADEVALRQPGSLLGRQVNVGGKTEIERQ